MAIKEKTEWTRVWCVNCRDTEKKRILLIGDSVCDGYYDTVLDCMKENYNVDKLVTSRALDSEVFFAQLETILKDSTYHLISFNNGLHGFHLDAENYRDSYNRAMDLLKVYNVVILKTTPLTVPDDTENYGEENETVKERNRIAEHIAAERGLRVLDLYSYVFGNAEIRLPDGFHYTEQGYQLIGKYVADFLLHTDTLDGIVEN